MRCYLRGPNWTNEFLLWDLNRRMFVASWAPSLNNWKMKRINIGHDRWKSIIRYQNFLCTCQGTERFKLRDWKSSTWIKGKYPLKMVIRLKWVNATAIRFKSSLNGRFFLRWFLYGAYHTKNASREQPDVLRIGIDFLLGVGMTSNYQIEQNSV